MTSAETIARALDGHPYADGFLCRCPVVSHGRGRGDTNKSLMVKDGHSTILVHCFAGCDTPDVLDALDQRGFLEKARRRANFSRQRPNATAPSYSREPEPHQRALELWRTSKPIEGTLAERYLSEHRGLDGPYPPAVRFLPSIKHPRTGIRLPAMIAGLSRPDKKIVAVQLTFLRPRDGAKAKLDMPRQNIGRMGTGAVRLEARIGQLLGEAKRGSHHSVTTEGATVDKDARSEFRILARNDDQLGLAEGIETALSATALTGVLTWATLGATKLPNITVPSSVKTVHIFADNDDSGTAAAKKSADKYEVQGKRVILHKPASQFADFNDWQRHLSGRRG